MAVAYNAYMASAIQLSAATYPYYTDVQGSAWVGFASCWPLIQR